MHYCINRTSIQLRIFRVVSNFQLLAKRYHPRSHAIQEEPSKGPNQELGRMRRVVGRKGALLAMLLALFFCAILLEVADGRPNKPRAK